MLPWCRPTVLIQATSCSHNHKAKLLSRPIVCFVFFHLKHSVCYHAVGLCYRPALFLYLISFTPAACKHVPCVRSCVLMLPQGLISPNIHPLWFKLETKSLMLYFWVVILDTLGCRFFCTDHGYPNLRHVQRIMAITQIHSLEFGCEENH